MPHMFPLNNTIPPGLVHFNYTYRQSSNFPSHTLKGRLEEANEHASRQMHHKPTNLTTSLLPAQPKDVLYHAWAIFSFSLCHSFFGQVCRFVYVCVCVSLHVSVPLLVHIQASVSVCLQEYGVHTSLTGTGDSSTVASVYCLW